MWITSRQRRVIGITYLLSKPYMLLMIPSLFKVSKFFFSLFVRRSFANWLYSLPLVNYLKTRTSYSKRVFDVFMRIHFFFFNDKLRTQSFTLVNYLKTRRSYYDGWSHRSWYDNPSFEFLKKNRVIRWNFNTVFCLKKRVA